MHGLRYVGLIGLLLFVLAAFTPLANLLNIRMAGQAHIVPSDAIVVMGRGGADSDGVLTNRSLRRLLLGVDLYNGALAPVLVLSGSAPETEARKALAREMGVPDKAISGQRQSANHEKKRRPRYAASCFRWADSVSCSSRTP